jgi:hypothetical protein
MQSGKLIDNPHKSLGNYCSIDSIFCQLGCGHSLGGQTGVKEGPSIGRYYLPQTPFSPLIAMGAEGPKL